MNKTELIRPGAGRFNQLHELKRRVNEAQEVICLLGDQVLEKRNQLLCEVIEQGQRLIQLKKMIKQGDWLEWLAINTTVEERCAQIYMKVAANPNCVSEAKTLTEALTMLRSPKDSSS